MSWLSDSSTLSGLDFSKQKAPPSDCICTVFRSIHQLLYTKAPQRLLIRLYMYRSIHQLLYIQKAPTSDCICI